MVGQNVALKYGICNKEICYQTPHQGILKISNYFCDLNFDRNVPKLYFQPVCRQ